MPIEPCNALLPHQEKQGTRIWVSTNHNPAARACIALKYCSTCNSIYQRVYGKAPHTQCVPGRVCVNTQLFVDFAHARTHARTVLLPLQALHQPRQLMDTKNHIKPMHLTNTSKHTSFAMHAKKHVRAHAGAQCKSNQGKMHREVGEWPAPTWPPVDLYIVS